MIRIFQSETYDIIDAIYYSLNNWTLYKSSSVSVSSGANSVTITSPSANGLIYAAADTSYYTGNIYFKFKVVSFTGTIGVRYDSTSTRTADFSTDLSVQTNDTVKVYDDGSYVKILVNDVEKVSVAHSSQIRFGLRIEAGSSVELTDIKVYPI